MFPSSLTVILTGLFLGSVALAVFAWAWRRGQFDALDETARVMFEPRDWRIERPWESPAQRAARRERHGPALEPRPGEWGGAA
ncbi:MAG TPA: cbb3-type cytochrome oxidase assembly protein [Longimicrobiales bacterium]